MAFTVGSGTFTNGSATVTNVSLTSGTLAYFASGTRMVVGVNPLIQEVEAIAAPTVSTITLRSAWTGTGGTYDFLANQTSEGLRDAVQSIRSSNATIQQFIDSIDVQNTNDSVVQRTANGRVKTSDATESNDAVALGQIPNSAPSALYGRSNILGSVAQSGGVPTGAIIQRGSNANGEFVRYADGTLICNHNITQSTPGNDVRGSLYIANLGTWTYPSAFTQAPKIFGTPDLLVTPVSGVNPCAVSRSSSTAIGASSVGALTIWYDASSSLVESRASLMAIGRWF